MSKERLQKQLAHYDGGGSTLSLVLGGVGIAALLVLFSTGLLGKLGDVIHHALK